MSTLFNILSTLNASLHSRKKKSKMMSFSSKWCLFSSYFRKKRVINTVYKKLLHWLSEMMWIQCQHPKALLQIYPHYETHWWKKKSIWCALITDYFNQKSICQHFRHEQLPHDCVPFEFHCILRFMPKRYSVYLSSNIRKAANHAGHTVWGSLKVYKATWGTFLHVILCSTICQNWLQVLKMQLLRCWPVQ